MLLRRVDAIPSSSRVNSSAALASLLVAFVSDCSSNVAAKGKMFDFGGGILICSNLNSSHMSIVEATATQAR